MDTPKGRATAEVDSARCNRATAENRRASNFCASRRLYPNGRDTFHLLLAGHSFSFTEIVRSRKWVCPGGQKKRPPGQYESRLEVESQFPRDGSGCHVVGSAEGGEEVVKRDLVRHVDDGHASAPFEAVFVEQIVITEAEIKEVARCNTGRIMVVVCCPWRRDLD